eukprot:SAG22_NODE_3205_length_1858_cov_1.195566_2_plen_33_part_00
MHPHCIVSPTPFKLHAWQALQDQIDIYEYPRY